MIAQKTINEVNPHRCCLHDSQKINWLLKQWTHPKALKTGGGKAGNYVVTYICMSTHNTHWHVFTNGLLKILGTGDCW